MDDSPTREELIAAREDLQRQLEIVRNPIRGMSQNPPHEAKLRSLMNEINECLAAMDAGEPRRS
jgi:hypothetical protein